MPDSDLKETLHDDASWEPVSVGAAACWATFSGNAVTWQFKAGETIGTTLPIEGTGACSRHLIHLQTI